MLVRILVSRNDVQKWGYSIVGASVSIGPHLVRVSSCMYRFLAFPAGAFQTYVYVCTLGTESLVVCT